MALKRLLVALAGALLTVWMPQLALAQYSPIPNYSGVGAGKQFRTDINNHLSGVTPIAPRLVSVPFANLPAEQDGQLYYCLDCQQTIPCAGGGTGAFALGAQAQWECTAPSVSGTVTLTSNLNANGHKVINLGANTTAGDALSQAKSHLNDLATATASYSMGGNRLTGVGAPSTENDALSLGNTGMLAGNGATLDTTASPPVAKGFNVDYVFHTSAYGTLDSAFHSTTCSGSSGSNQISCLSVPWPLGSWVTILSPGTGPACDDLYSHLAPNPGYTCNVTTPTPTLTAYGTNDGASYTYKIIPIDPLGGWGPVGATATTSAGPTTLNGTGLTHTGFIWISWTPAANESPWTAICRGTSLIGVTDNNSWIDFGQPALTDPLLPSCSGSATLTNEALRAQVIAISGTTVTISQALNASISNATVVTDATGGDMAAIEAAEAVGNSEVVFDPASAQYTRTAIVLGQNPSHFVIDGRGSIIYPQAPWGPALERADAANVNSAAQNVWIENLTIHTPSSATDSTRPALDGIWDGCAAQGGGFRNVHVVDMPHRDYQYDKGVCTYATKQVYDDFVLDGAGEMCAFVGYTGEIDDTYGHLFTRNCGQQVSATTGGAYFGSSFAGTYWQVSNPQFSFIYTSNSTHFDNALMFYGALGGHLGEIAFESTWPTGSASADLNITTSTGVTVDTISCNDSGGSASSCLQTVNSHDITVHEINGINGTRTLSCEWNNDSSGSLPNGENTLIGMTWTGNNPTNAICTPGPMIVARSGALAVGDDVSNLAQGQIEASAGFVSKATSAPSGAAGFGKLWFDATNNRYEMYNGTSGPALLGTGDAGSCPANSVVTAVNQGAPPTCSALTASRSAWAGMTTSPPSTATTQYFLPSGSNYSSSESLAQVPLVTGGTIKNLVCFDTTVPGSGNSDVITVRVNNASTALTCTISGTAASCSDTTHTASAGTNAWIDFMDVTSGTPAARALECGIEIDI